MPRVRKTPGFEKIEELAKKVPAPLSWLIPNPYDVGSYIMPVAGLTRLGGARKLVGPTLKQGLSSTEREGLLTTLRAWLKTPKKVQEFVKDIKLGTDYPWYGSKQIGLPTTVDPEAAVHELIHAAQDKLLRKRGTTLQRLAAKEKLPIPPWTSRMTTEFFPDVYTEGVLHNLGYETGTTLNLSTRKIYRELIKNINTILKQYKGK